jgi:DNA repair exonuclease SbcCD ATPase subunit
MAGRVRFLTLTLAGFGRYDRATRFQLDGRSVSFTSPNELGKSTFLAGLIATLFGPPQVRAKLAAFQQRHRSWSRPPWFWGELDFCVGDERWRVRQDFDAPETQVWRVSAGGSLELHYEDRIKPARKPADNEGYARLLDDWLGITDRSFYEAMFTISQESTVATSWQIDPRIAERVYGPAVRKLRSNLQETYDRFRDLTRNTREHQVSLGSQGERNGRSDGRLDQTAVQIAELEARQSAARERVNRLSGHRSRLAELDQRCDQLRQQTTATARSLENWQAWVELESQLQPAVETYERLSQLNQRCQQVSRPLAELRARQVGELAVFDRASDDLDVLLRRFPRIIEARESAQLALDAASAEGQGLRDEIATFNRCLSEELGPHVDRPQLADQVEELRRIRAEIAELDERHRRIEASAATAGERRQTLEQRLASLECWRPRVVADARGPAEQFRRDHGEWLSTQRVIHEEEHWLREAVEQIAQLDADHQELLQNRRRERSSIEAAERSARVAAESAQSAREQLDAARHDIERRYVDFTAAPDNLPELWDQWRRLESRQNEARTGVALTRDVQVVFDRRTLWRRGLSWFGAAAVLASLAIGQGWLDRFVASAMLCLCLSLRWIYKTSRVELDSAIARRVELELQARVLAAERDLVAQRLGTRFVVPIEREAEWRRLWPTYRRELTRLAAQTHAAPSDGQVADLIDRAANAKNRLGRHEVETDELARDAERRLEQARAERQRRELQIDRLQAETAAHRERYFRSADATLPSMAADALPDWWKPIRELAAADGLAYATVDELVQWCLALQDSDWSAFEAHCDEARRIEAELAAEPATTAALVEQISTARELRHLRAAAAERIAESIAPFTAETDPAWLRAQWQACESLREQVAERERRLETLRPPAELTTVLDTANTDHAAAAAILQPYLSAFGNDLELAAVAYREWMEVTDRVRELERQAAEVLGESGYATLEQLAHDAGRAEGLVGTIRTRSAELLEQANELWEAVDASPDLPAERVHERAALLTDQQSALDAAERERADVAATIRQMEADPECDADSVAGEIESLRRQLSELEQERDRLAASFQEANRLMQELMRVERSALEGRITAFFMDFSRTSGRRVDLDEELRIGMRNDDDARYAPDQLSHGARDQLYLAVYLATTVGFDLPFVLDDPFVNCDSERLAAIRACWDRLVGDHQLILLSHDPRLAAWAPPVEMREAA